MALKSRTRKLLAGAVAAVALGSYAATTRAAFFDMELTVSGGAEAPAGPFYGSFELPNYTGVGTEVFAGDGSHSGSIVDFIVTITTIEFKEDDDPSLFQIEFKNGVYDGMSFLSKNWVPFDLEIINNTWTSQSSTPPGPRIYSGTVEVNLVPVPAALSLFATALGALTGVGAWRRRGLRGHG